jgi:hypothetical protein
MQPLRAEMQRGSTGAQGLNAAVATVAHAVVRRCNCARTPQPPTPWANEDSCGADRGPEETKTMKYAHLTLSIAALGGAVAMAITAPAHAAIDSCQPKASQACAAGARGDPGHGAAHGAQVIRVYA